jgi:hypothetical protein
MFSIYKLGSHITVEGWYPLLPNGVDNTPRRRSQLAFYDTQDTDSIVHTIKSKFIGSYTEEYWDAMRRSVNAQSLLKLRKAAREALNKSLCLLPTDDDCGVRNLDTSNPFIAKVFLSENGDAVAELHLRNLPIELARVLGNVLQSWNTGN